MNKMEVGMFLRQLETSFKVLKETVGDLEEVSDRPAERKADLFQKLSEITFIQGDLNNGINEVTKRIREMLNHE